MLQGLEGRGEGQHGRGIRGRETRRPAGVPSGHPRGTLDPSPRPPSQAPRVASRRVPRHSPLEECMAALAFCSFDFCSFGGILSPPLLVSLPEQAPLSVY